ncbi:MAG: penicillin-binding transpeptidase domain-containing protein [Gemmatimonadaceae bacterium]
MKPGTRAHLVHGSLMLFAAGLVCRAAYVQLWQGQRWSVQAERQQVTSDKLPAPRGTVFDIAGVPLAQSRAVVSLAVAPREVTSADSVTRALAALGVDKRTIARALDPRRKWVPLARLFPVASGATVRGLRGVHVQRAVDRAYVGRQSTQRILGHLGANGRAVDGLELSLDASLRGHDGTDASVRDALGGRTSSPGVEGVEAEPGADVVLTINQALQDISERALSDAVVKMRAEGGDIVIVDPHTGEIRALATYRKDPRSMGSPALSETFEPGSTLKPFMAAALLVRGLARPDEAMDVEQGVFTVAGRTVHDIHKADTLTLREVIAQSSNVGIVKFSQRLSAREQFETLRDFGFGTPTGVTYPSESGGRLRPPSRWTAMSPSALAMGYEMSVTALQLALAYAAFANGGELLEPALVKEVRTSAGIVSYRHERRVVRRVVPREIADTVRSMLRETVAAGTASDVDLANFAVAGKTGTARRNVAGRYVPNQFTPTFVGLFPADKPQYVIVVKLDNPVGAYYGGKTAAPVSRVVLEAAIVAQNAALDRGALAASALLRAASPAASAAVASAEEPASDVAPRLERADTPVVFTLPVARPVGRVPDGARAVPEVRGLPLRAAVRELHRAGFRVRITGAGGVAGTVPGAGAVLPAKAVVRLTAAP